MGASQAIAAEPVVEAFRPADARCRGVLATGNQRQKSRNGREERWDLADSSTSTTYFSKIIEVDVALQRHDGLDTASCASDYCTHKATPRSSLNTRGCMLLNDNTIAASRFPSTSPPPKCRIAAALVRVADGQTPVSPLSQVFWIPFTS